MVFFLLLYFFTSFLKFNLAFFPQLLGCYEEPLWLPWQHLTINLRNAPESHLYLFETGSGQGEMQKALNSSAEPANPGWFTHLPNIQRLQLGDGQLWQLWRQCWLHAWWGIREWRWVGGVGLHVCTQYVHQLQCRLNHTKDFGLIPDFGAMEHNGKGDL